jgi:hypothetical protein
MGKKKQRNMLLVPFIRALRRDDWKLRYDTVAGGGRCVEFFKFYGQREVQVQLHDDGLFRATHMLYSDRAKRRGRMSTSPTTFHTPGGMWCAIKIELERTDHPPITASRADRESV